MTDTQLMEAHSADAAGVPAQHTRRNAEASWAAGAPPGWTYNPSAWSQRVPLLALALLNCGIATYLGLVQVGAIGYAWDPFFGDGTMHVLNSSLSRAIPVPDALVGACAYFVEAVCIGCGGSHRWRRAPWLCVTFVLLTIPLWLTSIVLVGLQAVVIHAWCTLCLIVAAGMFLIAPLALDEAVAAAQCVIEASREGQSAIKVLFRGASTENDAADTDSASRSTGPLQGFSYPLNLIASVILGVWMVISPAILHTRGEARTSAYISGVVLIAVSLLACAEPARTLRILAVACGLWLFVFAPWSLTVTSPSTRFNEVAVGLLVIVCAAPRGKIREHYGVWDRYLI